MTSAASLISLSPPYPRFINNNVKAVEEKEEADEEVGVAAGGDLYTEAIPDPYQEPTATPEPGNAEEAYDFKQYDLKEYDLGGADRKVYDYGAYDEYGTATLPDPEEVGPGVAAETDVSESAVSMVADIHVAPPTSPPRLLNRVSPEAYGGEGLVCALACTGVLTCGPSLNTVP